MAHGTPDPDHMGAQEERPPLGERKHGERRGEIPRVAHPVGVGAQLWQPLDLGFSLPPRSSRTVARPRAADVLGDRVQPRDLVLRHDAAIEAPERVDEGLLQRVLGVGAAVEPAATEAEEPTAVPFVQERGLPRGAHAPRRRFGMSSRGGHAIPRPGIDSAGRARDPRKGASIR